MRSGELDKRTDILKFTSESYMQDIVPLDRCPKRERREKDGAVFSLGVEGLTEDTEDLLSLGLKFVPLQKVN